MDGLQPTLTLKKRLGFLFSPTFLVIESAFWGYFLFWIPMSYLQTTIGTIFILQRWFGWHTYTSCRIIPHKHRKIKGYGNLLLYPTETYFQKHCERDGANTRNFIAIKYPFFENMFLWDRSRDLLSNFFTYRKINFCLLMNTFYYKKLRQHTNSSKNKKQNKPSQCREK